MASNDEYQQQRLIDLSKFMLEEEKMEIILKGIVNDNREQFKNDLLKFMITGEETFDIKNYKL